MTLQFASFVCLPDAIAAQRCTMEWKEQMSDVGWKVAKAIIYICVASVRQLVTGVI